MYLLIYLNLETGVFLLGDKSNYI